MLKIALLNASGPVLLPGFLPKLAECPQAQHDTEPPALDLDRFIVQRLHQSSKDIYAETHSQVDRLLLERTLEYTQGNHREAARLLGISRQTMRVRLRTLGLHVAHTVESDDA